MSCALKEGLSFCVIDDHPVFMDLPADRYFELPPLLEDAFMATLRNPSEADHAQLLRAGIFVESDKPSSPPVATNSETCRRSVTELPDMEPLLSVPLALEVLGLVRTTARWLRTKPLYMIIDELVRQRSSNARSVGCSVHAEPPSALVETSASFLRARLYAPTDTLCLLDTISLCRFLERRRLPWTMVFGVTRYPFAAHCWAQVDDLVLNDTVGSATAHTPIRVV